MDGLRLAESFWHDHVCQLLQEFCKGLDDGQNLYTAGLIGSGSEILGFDTEMSQDHDFGPRCMIFFEEEVPKGLKQFLGQRLPKTFHGFSTNFSAPDPNDNGTQQLVTVEEGQKVNHRIECFTVPEYIAKYLGYEIDPDNPHLSEFQWLSIPSQRLLAFTTGRLFYTTPDSSLVKIREYLAYYPKTVWLYLIQASWSKISEENPFVGRTGIVGDDLGSRVITSRLVEECMNLAFLLSKKYAPYSKWFGSGFSKLLISKDLQPFLTESLEANDWQSREAALNKALSLLASHQNSLGIASSTHTVPRQFFTRPFRIIQGQTIADVISSEIPQDSPLHPLASNGNIGGIDQFTTSTAILSYPSIYRLLPKLYQSITKSK